MHDGMLPDQFARQQCRRPLDHRNIYLDLSFTSWSAFGKLAAVLIHAGTKHPSRPITTGDYNDNHIVDAADYTVWRDTLGHTVPNGTGADGNTNGIIDSRRLHLLEDEVRHTRARRGQRGRGGCDRARTFNAFSCAGCGDAHFYCWQDVPA